MRQPAAHRPMPSANDSTVLPLSNSNLTRQQQPRSPESPARQISSTHGRVPISRVSSASGRSRTLSSSFSSRPRVSCTSPGCLETFSRSTDMRRHRVRHNFDADLYVCSAGHDYSSLRLDKIREHCRTKHGHAQGNEQFLVIDMAELEFDESIDGS